MDDLSTTILLIEDDASHATLLTRWLESISEYRVKHVSSGLAGIDLAMSSEWDLVISDIDLPDINGLELCRQAKVEQPLMPVLLITAHEGIDYPLKAIKYKVDDFLLKPFNKITLLEMVKSVLQKSRTEKSKKQVRVLAVGAHPDDIEIGCGGILLRHKANGDKICILTMSTGEKCVEPENRIEEITKVAKKLNSKLIIGNYQNDETNQNADAINFIKKAIDSFKPTVIYTHSVNDSDKDHHNIHLATIVAAQNVPSIYCYQSSTVTSDFHPGLFIDISSYINDKVTLLSYYNNLSDHNNLQEVSIRSTAKYWGKFCNVAEIEPLEVVRAIN
jgi:DNA-binding response OmpR family regulator